MFTVNELELLKRNYNEEYAKDIKEGKHPDDLFTGIKGIWEPLDLSADEVMINTLDEEMTEEQFMEWGVAGDRELTILKYYEKHNAVIESDASWYGMIPDRTKDIPPFRYDKANNTSFSQDQRKFVLNLLYLMFEKGSLSKQELLYSIGIH